MEQDKINGQLYRQVFVNSEADLPKEEGRYFVGLHNGDFDIISWFPDDYYCLDKWMKSDTDSIDWYLQTVDQQCTCGGYPDCICDITKAAIKYNEQYLNDCIKKATPGLSKIKDVDKTLDEIRGRDPLWDNSKVIDFVNWYLRMIKVIDDKNCRFELENQNVIDSFLNGDDYKLWWRKVGQPEQPKEISVTDEEIEKHAKEYLKAIHTPITKREVHELLVIFGHWMRRQVKANGLK